MSFRRRCFSCLIPVLGALLSSPAAAVPQRVRPAAQAGDLAPGGYRWIVDGPWDGPIYMVISIDRQMVHVYSGDLLIGMASVSTGMAGHRTPIGDYPILQKNQWHRSNLYSNAPMPFMQRLTWDGIALHAGHNPGYPASHGCIRLPYAFAQKLFGITRLGTLVNVTRDRLSPALMVDGLMLADADTTVVTFPSPAETPALVKAPAPAVPVAPLLEIDPGIFALRLSRR